MYKSVEPLKLDLTKNELDVLNSFIVEYINKNNVEGLENDLKNAFEKIILLHIKSLIGGQKFEN